MVIQRKKTLLKELKNKGKTGGIVDKRFGEDNPNLTPEEKMQERFTKEKQVCLLLILTLLENFSIVILTLYLFRNKLALRRCSTWRTTKKTSHITVNR